MSGLLGTKPVKKTANRPISFSTATPGMSVSPHEGLLALRAVKFSAHELMLARIYDGIELRPPPRKRDRNKWIEFESTYCKFWKEHVKEVTEIRKKKAAERSKPKAQRTPLGQLNWKTRRKKLEGSGTTKSLDRIYKRDGAICFHCRWYVVRSEASREHLLPLRLYPLLARDERFIVLSHKRCNL